MFIKLILILLIPVVSYGMTVFAAPDISQKIDAAIGVPGLSEIIRGTKENIDTAITDIPSIEEFKSGAVDIQNKVTESISGAKDTIDVIRDSAQKAEETYGEVKQTFNDAKQAIEGAQEKIGQIQGVVESVGALTGSGQ